MEITGKIDLPCHWICVTGDRAFTMSECILYYLVIHLGYQLSHHHYFYVMKQSQFYTLYIDFIHCTSIVKTKAFVSDHYILKYMNMSNP